MEGTDDGIYPYLGLKTTTYLWTVVDQEQYEQRQRSNARLKAFHEIDSLNY